MPAYPFDKCKHCGLNRVTVCDCEFQDSTCPNNHQWYRCSSGKRHEGEYDEDVPCSCVGEDNALDKVFDVNELNFSSDDSQEKNKHRDRPKREHSKHVLNDHKTEKKPHSSKDKHSEKPSRDKPSHRSDKPSRDKPSRHSEKPTRDSHSRDKPHRQKPTSQSLNVISKPSKRRDKEEAMCHMGTKKDKSSKREEPKKKNKDMIEFERQIQKQVRAQIKNQLKEQYKAEEEEDKLDTKHRRTRSHK